jgi:hypothetical protein
MSLFLEGGRSGHARRKDLELMPDLQTDIAACLRPQVRFVSA